MNLPHFPITRAEYDALTGINHSVLKHIKQSPAHLQYERFHKRPPTEAMAQGLVVDARLFGTDCKWEVSPYPDYRTKEAQQWRDARESAGITIVKQSVSQETERALAKIRAHPIIRKYLSDGRAQVGFQAELVVPGLENPAQVKCLADWICNARPLLLDLKTTPDASDDVFRRHIVNMEYDVQAAMYVRAVSAVVGDRFDYDWIVSESEPPHECRLFRAEPEILKRGSDILDARLLQYETCKMNDSWPGYPVEETPIGLPGWARSKMQGWEV